MRTHRVLWPATPLSHVPIGPKTGGFASPPYDGFALTLRGQLILKRTCLQSVRSCIRRHTAGRHHEAAVAMAGGRARLVSVSVQRHARSRQNSARQPILSVLYNAGVGKGRGVSIRSSTIMRSAIGRLLLVLALLPLGASCGGGASATTGMRTRTASASGSGPAVSPSDLTTKASPAGVRRWIVRPEQAHSLGSAHELLGQ